MVAPQQKVVVKKSVETHTEAPHKHASAQVSDFSKCQSLAFAEQGDSENTCIWCSRVNDLFSLVADLKEAVERLMSIRESERAIDWW